MRRKLLVLAVASAMAVLTATAAQAGGKVDDKGSGVESRDVTFTVENVNRSNLKCATDGETYQIRGQIVGPRESLDKASTASLYAHGLELGEFFWTTEAEGATFVERLANDGHVSVVIDRLSYDSSGKPNGFDSCFGGQADITDQIIDDLRSGDYVTGDGKSGDHKSASFEQVVLGGHSVGGLITALTQNSFGSADGIIVMSYSSFILSDAAMQAAVIATEACDNGGTTTTDGDAEGYAFFAPSEEAFRAAFFLSADPAVADVVVAQRNNNPSGDILTFAAGQQADAANADKIDVPALVTIGAEDAIFPEPSGPREVELLQQGSDDLELNTVSPSNHAVTVEETAPEFTDGVSDWLGRHGFGS